MIDQLKPLALHGTKEFSSGVLPYNIVAIKPKFTNVKWTVLFHLASTVDLDITTQDHHNRR